MKISFVILLVCTGLMFAGLGLFETFDTTNQGAKAEWLFFGLALVAFGAAAGLLLL